MHGVKPALHLGVVAVGESVQKQFIPVQTDPVAGRPGVVVKHLTHVLQLHQLGAGLGQRVHL